MYFRHPVTSISSTDLYFPLTFETQIFVLDSLFKSLSGLFSFGFVYFIFFLFSFISPSNFEHRTFLGLTLGVFVRPVKFLCVMLFFCILCYLFVIFLCFMLSFCVYVIFWCFM